MEKPEDVLKKYFYNGHHIELHSGDLEDVKKAMVEYAKILAFEAFLYGGETADTTLFENEVQVFENWFNKTIAYEKS